MSLSRVGGSSVAATSVTIPAHVAGDLIIIWAFRDGSTTPPTIPTAGGTVPTFTAIDNPTGANTCSAVCAWAIAAGTTDTSGTWTNATGISVEVWRGASNSPIGDHAQSGANVASGGNIAIPAISPQDPGGNSVYLSFAAHRNVTAWNAAPAGYTQRSQVATECEAITKDSTTSDGSFNVTCTASATGGTRTQQLEILADLGNRVSQVVSEVVYGTSGAKARISQEAAEVVYSTTGAKSRLSQHAVEVLGHFPTGLGNRVSQVVVEVLQKAVHTFTATISGSSSLSASFRALRRITGTIAGTSSLTATFRSLRRITATIAGTSSLTISLRSLHRITATIAGQGSLNATVSHGGGGTHSFTGTIAGTSTLRAALPYFVPSGVLSLDADVPAIYPAEAPSGKLALAATAPSIALMFIPSGALELKADAPTLTTTATIPSAKMVLKADPPKLTTLGNTPSGVLNLAGDRPNLSAPFVPVGARLLLTVKGPVIYPAQASSGVLRLLADRPTIPTDFIMHPPSGVLILAAGHPTIIPPVIPTGAGNHISVTV